MSRGGRSASTVTASNELFSILSCLYFLFLLAPRPAAAPAVPPLLPPPGLLPSPPAPQNGGARAAPPPAAGSRRSAPARAAPRPEERPLSRPAALAMTEVPRWPRVSLLGGWNESKPRWNSP